MNKAGCIYMCVCVRESEIYVAASLAQLLGYFFFTRPPLPISIAITRTTSQLFFWLLFLFSCFIFCYFRVCCYCLLALLKTALTLRIKWSNQRIRMGIVMEIVVIAVFNFCFHLHSIQCNLQLVIATFFYWLSLLISPYTNVVAV